ncbi:neuroligin-like protein glit-1 isoform X2 [Cloeon dipterum]|uniref:neuroligin-like protein glit-1 isoform X2 n=1 Tax=Cloeon dipterum TaxID=197152 RepID=UPI00321FAD96
MLSTVVSVLLVLLGLQGWLGAAQEGARLPWDQTRSPLDQQQQREQYENNRRFGEYVDNNQQRNWGYPDRGYGHQQPGGVGFDGHYFNTRLRGGVGAGGVGGNFYGNRYDDPQHPTPFPQPGILAGWRPDLQGRQRPDSINLINDRDVYVSTPFGQIQGFKVHLYDNPNPLSYYRPGQSPVDRIQGNCSVFLGIPYAQPPVREGRFKPPRAHKGWQLLQAVDFGPACPQPLNNIGATKGIRDVDEDCLYLNVYSPHTQSGLAQPFPVMVYIHGGDYQKGASNLFPAHVLASFYDVVVVTINYRLGALGFLSTGDENSPGNYGVLDQAMALRWVHENIEFFNGDRNLITLFGPGAGAASAGLLMVAPRTRQLVSRVIAQSGSALADWAIIEDVYRVQNTSRVFSRLLGCNIDSSWNIVSCLKQRHFHELGNAEFPPDVGTFPWAPVLDKGFKVAEDSWFDGWKEKDWRMFQEMPEKSIKKGDFNHGLSYLSGITHDEAAFFIHNNESLAPDYEVDEKFFDQKIREFVFKYNYTLNPEGVYDAIKYMYTYWPDPHNVTHIREQYINFLSDFFYRAPSDKMAKLLVEKNIPVFLYHLNTSVEALRAPYWRRVPHDTEYFFLTGAPFMDHEFFPLKLRLENVRWTDSDRNMSHFFMKAYSFFARYGHPSHEQILGLHFQPAQTGRLYYLNLNTTYNSSIMVNYNQKECAFWSNYLPSVIGILVPTYPPTTEFWWEPNQPIQVAFWSITSICVLLLVIIFICCVLWRKAISPFSFQG